VLRLTAHRASVAARRGAETGVDDQEITSHLHDLQVSLKDGDDLARAIGLIGDALERRMTTIRGELEELREDGEVVDGDRLDEIVTRVIGTLDRYEGKLEERYRRMEEIADDFQQSLGQEAHALRDLRADLGDPDAKPGQHLPEGS
jgi:hypothetical protein